MAGSDNDDLVNGKGISLELARLLSFLPRQIGNQVIVSDLCVTSTMTWLVIVSPEVWYHTRDYASRPCPPSIHLM